AGVCLFYRQQHARLDLDQHGRHQQILGRQFEVVHADLLDIRQILPRDIGHRDVEHIEILLAYQVQQQVQRAFEGFQEYFKRVWRNVQVGRQLEQRFAVQARKGHAVDHVGRAVDGDRKSTRLNSSHVKISYAVFCLKKKKLTP